MTLPHSFGGQWTERKLARLRKYLTAYMKLMKSNERAKFFNTIFVDGFAGTGYRTIETSKSEPTLFDYDSSVEATEAYQKGSSQIALELEQSFDQYVFIEIDNNRVRQLKTLSMQYPDLTERVEILQGNSNHVLRDWCRRVNWKKNRAVVFLDPYGMAVEWQTIQELGETKAVDLWVLVPLAQAINRLLTKQPPPETWSKRLDIFFGTEEWQEVFYKSNPVKQYDMFEDREEIDRIKSTSFEGIREFFVQRLQSCFAEVVKKPLYLENSKKVPLYLLCFASANKTAVKIAQDIVK